MSRLTKTQIFSKPNETPPYSLMPSEREGFTRVVSLSAPLNIWIPGEFTLARLEKGEAIDIPDEKFSKCRFRAGPIRDIENPDSFQGHFLVEVFLPIYLVFGYEDGCGLQLLGSTTNYNTANNWCEQQKLKWGRKASRKEVKQSGEITIWHYLGGQKCIIVESHLLDFKPFEPLDFARIILDAQFI